MKINSIRFKASVLYSSILCLILVIFSAYIHHATQRILYKDLAEELRIKSEQLVGILNAYGEVTKGTMPPVSLVRRMLSNHYSVSPEMEAVDRLWERQVWILSTQNNLFRITDSDREVVLQSENMPSEASLKLKQQRQQKGLVPFTPYFDNLRIGHSSFRVMTMAFTFIHKRPLVLQLAAPLAAIENDLFRLVIFMTCGIVIVLLLSFSVGSFLTKKILDPVASITRTANSITQTSLQLRITGHVQDEEMRVLTESLNQMIERLERSFTHINEFSSHVAHELKTPLAIIKGELELALMRNDLGKEEHRVLTVASQEINRLVKIINDLLLLAKFEYKMDIFKMEDLDLSVFMKEVHEHALILAQGKEIRMSLEVPETKLLIRGDPVHLRRLFFNLLHNAVKFTPEGGSISCVVRSERLLVMVSVSDTGGGIDPRHQGRIFEKFYKAPQSAPKEGAGTGLGLCLARSIARAHGGDIIFKSELQQGTTFIVSLPLILPV